MVASRVAFVVTLFACGAAYAKPAGPHSSGCCGRYSARVRLYEQVTGKSSETASPAAPTPSPSVERRPAGPADLLQTLLRAIGAASAPAAAEATEDRNSQP